MIKKLASLFAEVINSGIDEPYLVRAPKDKPAWYDLGANDTFFVEEKVDAVRRLQENIAFTEERLRKAYWEERKHLKNGEVMIRSAAPSQQVMSLNFELTSLRRQLKELNS